MYYHGIINGIVPDKVIRILESGEISSATRMGASKKIGFNENDYVSVCKNLGEEVYADYPKNAFKKYVVNHFCFIIEDSIDAEAVEFIPDAEKMSAFELHKLKLANPCKRFSDIVDEYQVRDYIPLDKVIGIGIPYSLDEVDGYIKLSNFSFLTREEFDSFIKKVERMAYDKGLKVFDSSIDSFGNCIDKNSKII